MKKTIKLLTLLLAAVMMIQTAPLAAIGDSADADTYEPPVQSETVVEDQTETEVETEPETEAEAETEAPAVETPETEPETDAETEQAALAVESIRFRNGALTEAFETLTDGMTVNCNYLIICLTMNAAPETVEAYVDGVSVQAEIADNSVLLPIELLNGYHTFSFTVSDALNTVTAEFGLTVASDDASYPELNVKGASGLVLGGTSEIVITGNNVESLAEILVDIKMSTQFKVLSVDIAKGYTGTYSWYRGDLRLFIEIHDADKIADEVVATVRIKAPAASTPETDLFWNVESAVVTPAEGETVGKTENFQGTVSVPEVELTVVKSYTVESVTSVAIANMGYTLNVKNDRGENAPGVPVYVIKGRQNVLLGYTDMNGNLTTDYFVSKSVYRVFAEDDNGASSAKYEITCYEPVGPVDGTPYAILSAGACANGKTLTWMSNILSTGEAAFIRVATTEDMADAILYNGTSALRIYEDSQAVNRVSAVTVSDLTPGVYYYQVGDGDTWSETRAFTVKETSDSVNFAVIGDMANTNAANLALIAGALANSGMDYDFGIQTGNAIFNTGDHDAWFNAASTFASFGEMSFIHAYGKNEADANTVFGGEYGYRAYVYNNIFVAVIDYTEDEAALGDMLYDMVWDARAADYAWSILVINQAPYTTDSAKAESIAAKLVPTMAERAGIDLVLSGDECNYARTEELRTGVATVKNGVTYVVCGSAGEKANAIDNGEFAVTSDSFNALYISVTANADALTVTVYDVLEDGTVKTVDTFAKSHYVCEDGAHLFRFGVNTEHLICDYCGAKDQMGEFVGVIAINDKLMYLQKDGFGSGWKLYNGQYYYFTPGNYLAVDGRQTINYYTYVFENYVLTEGCWVTVNGTKKLMWAGKFLTSTWHTQGGKTYYFLKNGVCATGTVEIPTVDENGETVYETYVFAEDGALIGKQ